MTDRDRSPQQSLLCPACRVDLVMSERQRIEIDYCPKCRGVWLDRGELDKIIERTGAPSAQEAVPEPQGAAQTGTPFLPAQPAPLPQASYPYQGGYGDRDGYGRRDDCNDRGYRRRGFLGRLFDD